jgi:hypothetical protein
VAAIIGVQATDYQKLYPPESEEDLDFPPE